MATESVEAQQTGDAVVDMPPIPPTATALPGTEKMTPVEITTVMISFRKTVRKVKKKPLTPCIGVKADEVAPQLYPGVECSNMAERFAVMSAFPSKSSMPIGAPCGSLARKRSARQRQLQLPNKKKAPRAFLTTLTQRGLAPPLESPLLLLTQ